MRVWKAVVCIKQRQHCSKLPLCLYICIYSQSHFGWHFPLLFQSSKLKAWTSLCTETWQKRRSSFELWAFENDTPSGVGCTYTWQCIHMAVHTHGSAYTWQCIHMALGVQYIHIHGYITNVYMDTLQTNTCIHYKRIHGLHYTRHAYTFIQNIMYTLHNVYMYTRIHVYIM